MIETIKMHVRKCTCDLKCDDGKPYVWLAMDIDGPAPTICPNCRSRTWNGKQKLGRRRSITMLVPSPKKVRV